MAGIEAFFEKTPDDEKLEDEVSEEEETESDEEDGAVSDPPADEESTESVEDEENPDGEETISEAEEEDTEEAEDGTEDQTTIIADQRRLLRELAQANRENERQIAELTEKLAEGGQIDPDEMGTGDEYGLSQERVDVITQLGEMMRLNPKYEDFDEICSQSNFDTVITAVAHQLVEEDGGRLSDRMVEAEAFVWGQSNPYRYVYDIVKEFHPSYAPAESVEKEVPAKSSKKKEAPPRSLSSVPGGSGGQKEGWTASKIDKMDEMDLASVPADVYERYLSGELD